MTREGSLCPCGHAWLLHDVLAHDGDGTDLCCVEGCDQKACPGRTSTDEERRLRALSRFTPTNSQTWEPDARTDAVFAVDIVAQVVLAEAKKNPVERREAFLGYPAMNSHLFGQSMHDVGRAVMDALIKAGWRPSHRHPVSTSENGES